MAYVKPIGIGASVFRQTVTIHLRVAEYRAAPVQSMRCSQSQANNHLCPVMCMEQFVYVTRRERRPLDRAHVVIDQCQAQTAARNRYHNCSGAYRHALIHPEAWIA